VARTVKVALQAEVGQYKRGVGEAERATKKLGDALEDIDGKPLDDAAAKAKGLGDSADDAADRASRDFDEIKRHADTLDRKIRDTETGMRSLARAFATTGDPKILAAWKEQGRVLGDLRNVRKALPDPAQLTAAGVSMGQRLGAGITKSLPAPMYQAIAAGAVAGAPFVAATLVGAVTGGAALGGIGAGIALSLKDPQIKKQAKDLGADLSFMMRRSAQAFSEAMPEAIGKARTLVSGLQDDLNSVFTSSAGYLGPFLDTIAPGIEAIVSGLEKVIGSAGPTLAIIGKGLSDIMVKVGEFLNMVSQNSDTGARALELLFAVIEVGIGMLTTSVDMLATAYKYTLGWTSLFSDADEAVDKFGKTGAGAAGSTRILGIEVEETGKKVEVAKNKFVALNEQIQTIVDRNMSAAEANIQMRSAVKSLTDAVDKKKKVTDDERTALIQYARTTNSATKALDEQGRTTGQASKAHENNRKKLIAAAIQMGYSEGAAKRLANQYLATPKGVTTKVDQPGMKTSREETKKYHGQLDKLRTKINTKITVEGDATALRKLERLLVAQQAAKKGISVSAAQSAFNKNAKGFHSGGYTGPGAKMQPAGIVHADEFVVKKESRRRIERTNPGLLDELNATGQLPGHAAGGMVMPVRVDASMTKVISMAEALSKVAPSFGNWPSSPSAQRGDSGVWRKVLQLIRSGPKMGSFGNAYRPGDPKWHGSGRAVDWMGFNMDGLAKYLAAKRPLELIHRTKNRDYAYTRGRNMGSFSAPLMNAHRNHIHVAMAGGGVIPEPVIGVGASGRSYSFAERGPERVLSTGQTMAAANSGRVITMTLAPVININGANQSASQIAAQVDRQIGAQFNQFARGISS
jgi:hypothetical protein